ncbi:Panacea domain-containing protein [Campylobacter helveticus]|uniref:Panacea domain-containing protein n=1 Tax=Campylobacter helveticus TaxID=28898 RepID=UPI00214B9CB2|nr:Panacea domain-containing protein [Campylobacter helveticus]MCR2060668.1 Panacea domain-containing protein [Campylobacter helveticus]
MNKVEKIINYIIYSFRDEPLKLGKLKLAKILWYADRAFMYKYYQSLTNLEYIKMQYGPLPKKYDNILKKLNKEKIIHSYESNSYGESDKKQICYHSLIEPDMNDFEAKEIQIIDEVIARLKNKKATTLSKETHDELWKNTNIGESMPIESVFLNDIEPPNEEDIQWAKEILKSKGLYAN